MRRISKNLCKIGSKYYTHLKPCILKAGHRGSHHNGRYHWHQATQLVLSNGRVLPEVDCGIADIVYLLNSIKGLKTGMSCQGGKRNSIHCAYVTIYGKLAGKFYDLLKGKKCLLKIGGKFKDGGFGFYWWEDDTPKMKRHFKSALKSLSVYL